MDAVKIKFKLPRGQRKLFIVPMFVYVGHGDELTVRKSLGKQMNTVYRKYVDTSNDVVVLKCKNSYWQLQRSGSLKIEFAPGMEPAEVVDKKEEIKEEEKLVEEEIQTPVSISEISENRSMTSRPERIRRKKKNGIS